MAAPVEGQGGVQPHPPPPGMQAASSGFAPGPGSEDEDEEHHTEMAQALGVLAWLRELHVHPPAQFTIRAFLALHIRREAAAQGAGVGDAGPVHGRPVASDAAESEASTGEPSFARGMSIATCRLQELYEEQTLAQLKALARISTAVPASQILCETMQSEILHRYLAQIEAIVQCGAEERGEAALH